MIAIGLGAGVALGVRARGGGDAAGGIAKAGAALDGHIGQAADAARQRAQELARLPRLQAGVATDAATVRDLTGAELMFTPRPGEVIEIGQIPAGAAPVSLLCLPEGAPVHAKLDAFGTRLVRAGSELWVQATVEVAPSAGPAGLRGSVSVAHRVDLAATAAAVTALPGGRIELDGQVMAGASDALGSSPAAYTPSRDFAATLRLAARGGGRLNAALMAAGGGAALAGLITGLLLWRRASKAPAAPLPAARAANPTPLPPASDVPYGATLPVTSSDPLMPRESMSMPRAQTPIPSRAAITPVPAGAVATAAAPAPTGSVIGRFEVLRSLGSGGMAEVFLARSQGEAGFEKKIALKVIHGHLARTPVVVEHFLDEARLASQLTHPNIVQIVDLGKSGDAYYIAMEYIEGSDLERIIQGCRKKSAYVPLPIALAIVRKVCDGLHAAHTATAADGHGLDVVHRDVKAANVLLSRAGAVKLADFGIAKANQQVHKTEIGQTKGTAAYMAPEQRMGRAVDRRADVFGVGAILYEVLTNAEVNLDLMQYLDRGPEGWPYLPPPSQVRPEVPPALDAIVFRALAFEAEARHPSCDALEEELAVVVGQMAARYGLAATDKQIAAWVEAELTPRFSPLA